MLAVIGAIGGVYILGRYVVPWALKLTARDLGPGGFALMVLAGVFLAGWWMETVGLSMALGAFMIGILLSSTLYADQVKAAVAPTRQLLLALFFIAIGMAIDLEQLAQSKTELLLYLPALLLVKVVVLFVLARAFRFGLRSAVLTAFLMMPFDEIAYVIFASANANGLMNARDHTVGLAVISVSFIVSPMLINLGYRLSDRWIREPTSAERASHRGDQREQGDRRGLRLRRSNDLHHARAGANSVSRIRAGSGRGWRWPSSRSTTSTMATSPTFV